MKLGIDMIPVLLPDMTSSVVSGVLSLLYTCKLGQADSQLDQTIDVVRQLPPDLSLSVGGGSDGCLVLEASLVDINTTAITNILDTEVKYQGLGEHRNNLNCFMWVIISLAKQKPLMQITLQVKPILC